MRAYGEFVIGAARAEADKHRAEFIGGAGLVGVEVIDWRVHIGINGVEIIRLVRMGQRDLFKDVAETGQPGIILAGEIAADGDHGADFLGHIQAERIGHVTAYACAHEHAIPGSSSRAVLGVGLLNGASQHGGGIILLAESRLHDDHFKPLPCLDGGEQLITQAAVIRLKAVLGQQIDHGVVLIAVRIIPGQDDGQLLRAAKRGHEEQKGHNQGKQLPVHTHPPCFS